MSSKPSQQPNNKKIYKFLFSAFVHQVSLALKFPCVVSVTWRRGQKLSQVKQRREIQKGIVTFNQKLELQVNMVINNDTKQFEEKKTKFTVLIFSEKGNKQAGQISIDVAELLNTKVKQLKIQKNLEKCPDKNAKINITLSGYFKQEISSENVSKKSEGTIINSAQSQTTSSSIQQQPDFKKKKPEQKVNLEKGPQQKNQNQIQNNNLILPRVKSDKNIPQVSKENMVRLKLEEENKKLRQQLSAYEQVQAENETLKRRYKQALNKAESYYNKKYQQLQKQYKDSKERASKVEQIMRKKQQLQKEMCECKQKMGRILNFAIMSGNNEMTEEIYNIYQNYKP